MAFNSQPEEKFLLEEVFTSGFQDKLQKDEVPPGSAIAGSRNFTLDDDGKWMTRMGTTYLGGLAPSGITGGCTSAGRLRRRDGTEIPVIAHGTQTRYLHPDPGLTNASTDPDWVLFQEGFTDGAQFGFAVNDISSDNLNKLIFCNARENYRIWNGAVDVYSTCTATTITTASSSGLASGLFTPTGSIIVSRYPDSNDIVTFTYTGIAASTFTGVSPNPQNGFGPGDPFIGGEAITQAPVEYPSAPKGNVLLCTNNARALVANVLNATTNEPGGGQVYGSQIDNPGDFTFSSPRDPGDGFIVSYSQGGGTVTGLSQKENLNYVFKPETIQTLAFSTDGEDFVIQQPLTSYDERTSADEGAVSALAVFRAENTIVFVTPTNTINTVNRVQNIDYPQTLPISDAIKDTVDVCVFDSQTAGVGYRGRMYIACKSSNLVAINDLVLVYNLRYRAWEAPMTGLSIAAWFVYQTNLYGCLATSPDVVQLLTGTTDFNDGETVGVPIEAELALRRQNYGFRDKRKVFDQYYIEGEMDESGDALFTFTYDEGETVRQGQLLGTESGFFFADTTEGAFGLDPFGIETFGPEIIPGTDVIARKFRIILTTKELPFYTLSMTVTTSSYFKLIAHGPNARLTSFQKPKTVYKIMSTNTPPPVVTGDLLLEDGDQLLLEDGGDLVLETHF